jgi:hypothetical protein
LAVAVEDTDEERSAVCLIERFNGWEIGEEYLQNTMDRGQRVGIRMGPASCCGEGSDGTERLSSFDVE